MFCKQTFLCIQSLNFKVIELFLGWLSTGYPVTFLLVWSPKIRIYKFLTTELTEANAPRVGVYWKHSNFGNSKFKVWILKSVPKKAGSHLKISSNWKFWRLNIWGKTFQVGISNERWPNFCKICKTENFWNKVLFHNFKIMCDFSNFTQVTLVVRRSWQPSQPHLPSEENLNTPPEGYIAERERKPFW